MSKRICQECLQEIDCYACEGISATGKHSVWCVNHDCISQKKQFAKECKLIGWW